MNGKSKSTLPSEVGILPKPVYGEPCNGCGVCCRTNLCLVALGVGISRKITNCPLQKIEGGRVRCGAFDLEAAFLKDNPHKHSIVGDILGSGGGCDCLILGSKEDSILSVADIMERQFSKRVFAYEARKKLAKQFGIHHESDALNDAFFRQLKSYAHYR